MIVKLQTSRRFFQALIPTCGEAVVRVLAHDGAHAAHAADRLRPGPIRDELSGHVTRSPPITAHLDSVSVLVLRNLNSECEGAGEAGRLSFISRSWFRSGVNRSA